MDIRTALTEQLLAGLTMLEECVRLCPQEMWEEGEHPRTFWRVALHAAFFTHVYLGQNEAAYEAWPGLPEELDPAWMEPYELPEGFAVVSASTVLGYISFLRALAPAAVSGLDLEAPESGFQWYEGFPKMSHALMNLRHLEGHVGQLSERLLSRGIEPGWVSRG